MTGQGDLAVESVSEMDFAPVGVVMRCFLAVFCKLADIEYSSIQVGVFDGTAD